MPKFNKQNKKRIDPRYFLDETTGRDDINEFLPGGPTSSSLDYKQLCVYKGMLILVMDNPRIASIGIAALAQSKGFPAPNEAQVNMMNQFVKMIEDAKKNPLGQMVIEGVKMALNQACA